MAPHTELVGTLSIAAERLRVERRVMVSKRVRVRTTVKSHDELVQVALQRRDLSIERVAVDHEVATAPDTRQVGDVLIIPVVAERMVKRLFVVEEIHIRQRHTEEEFNQTVPLRHERAEVIMQEDLMAEPTIDLAPAGHDVHLYDPNIHDNQIVAVYDTMQQAEAAKSELRNAGVDGAAIELIDGNRTGIDQAPDGGFWGAVKSIFAPDEEALAFRHAMGRGHAMIIVHPAQTANREQIITVLEKTGPVDFDAKLEEWRQAGYDYSHAGQSSLRSETPTGAATGTSETAMGAVMAAGAAGAAGAMMTGAMTTGATMTGATMTGAMPVVVDEAKTQRVIPTTMADATGTRATVPAMDGDTIKVLQERLRVGKREIAQGSVRVRSYVIERPIEEQVRLHEERINVRRTAVDRLATAADQPLFQDRTIEARAMSEEAVINKEIHIVEEIGIEKQSSDRTETVHDTVRETKVELEDTTKVSQSTATPGATTSGSNSPRK